MTTLIINGQKVTVGDEFLSISPQDQEATVDEIARSLGGGQSGPSQSDIAASRAGSDAMTEKSMAAMGVQPNAPGMAASAMLGAAQGMTFGFNDEIAAGLDTGLGWLTGGGPSYDQALAGQRGYLDAAREAHPVAAYGGEIGGAVAGGVGVAKGLTKLAQKLGLPLGAGMVAGAPMGLAGKAAIGALAGIVEGGLAGFGTGEGGLANRGASAAKGAAIGGMVGAAAPVAIAGAGALLRTPANAVASALNIPSEVRAGNALQTYLKRSGMTADDVAQRTQQAAQEGQPQFMAADAMGNAGQRALSSLARKPGDAGQIIEDMLTKRQKGQGVRVSGFIADALDAPDTARQRVSSLTASRSSAADTDYGAARQNARPVNLNDTLSTIDELLKRDPILGETALSQGPIGSRLMALRNRMAAGGEQLIDFDTVLNIKSDLYEQIQKGRGGREMNAAYRALDAALEDASGMYRQANDGFAKASRAIDRIEEGKVATSGKERSGDVVPQYQKMPADQQAAFRSGYADPLIATIENSAPGVNKARSLLDDKNTAEFGAMANDPALWLRRLGREDDMFATRHEVVGNSKTAQRLLDDGDTSTMAASTIGNVAHGNFAGAAAQVMAQLASKFMSGATGSSPATRAIIAKMLMSPDPRAMLAPAAKAGKRNDAVSRVIEALIRSGGRVIGQ